MTSRERIITAIGHKEADRVPIAFGGLLDSLHRDLEPKVIEYLKYDNYTRSIQDPFQQIVYPDKRLLERFHSDIFPIYASPPSFFNLEIKDEGNRRTYYDQFGIKYRCMKPNGLYFDFEAHPMADMTLNEVLDFKMPDPKDPGRIKGLKEKARNLFENTDKAIIFQAPFACIVEGIGFLRGLENMYMDMSADLEMTEAVSQKILDWYKDFWSFVLDEVGEYVQLVQIGDDLGGQWGPLFSPDTYRKVFKWRHKELIDTIKKHTGAKIFYHGCGSMYEFIPDLIEVGVDVLNPVQVNAANMDTKVLKKEFGKDITFWGGGADPHLLSKATVEDVKKEVAGRLDDLKAGGGYIFAPVHNVQCDVPPENVVAIFDAAYEYGRY